MMDGFELRIAILQVIQPIVGKVIWLALNLGEEIVKKSKNIKETVNLPNFGCTGRGWDQND